MGKATREAYGEALRDLGAKNKDIVVLDADLSKSTKTNLFAKAYPERFFDVGIAEQNLMGTAAGLAAAGKIPFVSTFAMFAAGRAFEQFRNSICYPKLNVKIAATHAGLTVGEDGATHQAIEDISLMRSIPNMTVIVPADCKETQQAIQTFRDTYAALRAEIGKVIVGQESIVEGTLIALFAGGHVLLEGVPGLGKTLLVRTLSDVLDLSFNRIQFTPDLMPADILGTNIVMENPGGRREFEFQRGPIFAHLILADEINRATPKTQSAMLEAMQEHQVTAGGQLRKLVEPFFVMATQNPIDQEGTYPLPEAQLDRFFFKILVGYPTAADLTEVLNRTTAGVRPTVQKVLEREALTSLMGLVREVPVATHVKDYAVRLVLATHPKTDTAAPIATQYLRFGSSPRGAQTMILAAKVRALIDSRFNVSFDDLVAVAAPALRHRLILNFEAEAEGITTDHILAQIIKDVPRDAQAILA